MEGMNTVTSDRSTWTQDEGFGVVKVMKAVSNRNCL